MGNDDVSIKDLFKILSNYRWLIVTITIIFGCAAAAASFALTKKYDATVIVSPVADESSGGRLSSVVSQIGGLGSLSSLAGIPGGGSTQKSEIVAVLQSEALTEGYIRENNLLPVLYSEDWDASRNRWKESDPTKIPSLWKANVLFEKSVRSVSTDTKSGLVTLTIRWRDPNIAAKWANGLVEMTNDYLRKKTIDGAERNIAYLNAQAAKMNEVQVKETIYTILQNEIKKVMLARGNEEFALKVIDPAIPPEKAATPKLLTWTAMATIIGAFLAVCGVLIRHWWNSAA